MEAGSGRLRGVRRRALVALAAGLGAVTIGAGGFLWGARERGDREAEVAARGAEVMSFDLERTTHVFKTLADGGVQTVVADDPEDTREIRLIRSHLREETANFERGIFSDPARVHGGEMPGLAELEAGADRIDVTYEPVPAGGRIRYSTGDPELVAAIHEWFRAQVADHGRHAEGDL